MDTTQDITQVALPTDVVDPTDLKVEVVSMDFVNGTRIMNGTKPGEPVDYMPILADWAHGRNLPSLKSVLVGLATVAHVIVDFFLDYFLWRIVFTLAAVEAPHIIVPAPWTDKKSDDEDGIPQVQQERSITKSLRTTIRHLHGVGGTFAMCRGMALHVSINITAFFLATPMFVFLAVRSFGAEHEDDETASARENTLYSRLKEVLGNTAFDIVAGLVFCSWLAAWVHIVITQHTLRIWYRRLPPFLHTFYATWRPLVLLPLVGVLVRRTVVVLLKHSLGLYEGYESEAGTFTSRNMLLTLIWLLVQGMDLLVVLPLEVAVVRIQASLLPEDEEPIVPLDRSFGTGGSNGLRPGLLAEARGPLSLREAWRSLSWVEMRRLTKIFAKLLLVQAAFNAVFWLAIGDSAWPDKWVPSRLY